VLISDLAPTIKTEHQIVALVRILYCAFNFFIIDVLKRKKTQVQAFPNLGRAKRRSQRKLQGSEASQQAGLHAEAYRDARTQPC